MNWKDKYNKKKTSIEEAANSIESGDFILLGPLSGYPLETINQITAREEIENLTIFSALKMALPDFLNQERSGIAKYISAFNGPIERMFMDRGFIAPLSVHFSQISECIAKQKLDAAILDVSPPDAYGRMCIGPGNSLIGKSTFTRAKKVIVQVNPAIPLLNGTDMYLEIDEVDMVCEVDRPPLGLPDTQVDEVTSQIADLIVAEIPDGATLQLGIGNLADAIGEGLSVRKDLGIHSEMMTPSMIKLCKQGVVNGSRKTLHPEKVIVAFCIGDTDDLAYLHQNTAIEFYPSAYVNDFDILRKNDNLMSVNNALAVDMTGQVASESLGFKQYSATGGQLDFVRGARHSPGGKSFIALESTAEVGGEKVSRICSSFLPGTAVTTPRSEVQYVVTEYGIADLAFKSIEERVNEMIGIAHPDFREQLSREVVDGGLVHAAMIRS